MWYQLNNSFPSFVKLPSQSRTHRLSSFHNGMLSSMNSNSMNHHATGRLDLLELDIRHAQVHPRLLCSARCHHRGKRHETTEIQAQGYGVAYCRSTTGYTRGIFPFNSSLLINDLFVALKTRHPIFFPGNTQHCNCYPRHGPSRSTSCH